MKADKNFYKIFFSIAIVLVCQNVITLSVNLADNIMLGGYSETALSGVAAVNQLQFVFQQLVGALGDGLVIIGSQYWGKRQIEPMKIIAAVAMRSAVIVGLVLFMIVSVFPNQTMALFTTDSKIIKEGIRYLNVIRFSYLFFAVTQILFATLRSTEVVRIAFWLSVQTLAVNCGINYILIYGKFGFPELGAVGAANSASSTLFLAVKSVAIGTASAASIMIGKAIGEGDINVVKGYARTLQKIFLCVGICGGIFLFFIRIPVLSLYNLTEETRTMANTFLIILSVAFVGMSYQMPTNIGLIRGGGDAKFVMKMDLISIWGIVIPLSLIMAFVVEAPPAVVVCCLNADQIFKCIPAFIKVNYGNWIHKLTR